jgi:predicted dehydrogenase
MRAIAAGKHVLCEKPYSRSAGEVQEAFAAAEAAGVVLTEALMWRHHPQALRLAALVAGGAIGDLRMVRAAFSFPLSDPRDARLLEDLAGGGLMDVGCYCISAARMLAGEPVSVTAQQVLAPSGVDCRLAATLAHEDDVLTHFDCALDLPDRSELEAIGSDGVLSVSDPWHSVTTGIELRVGSRRPEHFDIPDANPYACELDDLAGAVAGEHPPRLGPADALGQARTIDAVLRAAASGRSVALS